MDEQPPPTRSLNWIYCIHCGQLTSIYGSELSPCSHCGKLPLDVLALAIELGLSSATYQVCPRCGRAHRFERYCYDCGAATGS